MPATIITSRKSGPINMDFGKAINNPTAGDIHVNRPLTNMAQKFLQDASSFIATRAMPDVPVVKQSDNYYIFNKEDFFRDDAKIRADGTESAGGGFKVSTDLYQCDVIAYHKDVTDRQRQNADEVIAPDRSASQFVAHKHLIRREVDWRDTFFVASAWDTESTPSPLWDAASSTPIVDIREQQTTIHGITGFRPNRMVIGREVWDALVDNDDLLNRIIGGATRAIPAQVMRELVAQLLELDQILVMDGVVTTSAEGASPDVTTFIGGKNALLYYTSGVINIEGVTAGANFNWTGLLGNSPNGMRVKRFRMENLESDRVEGQMAFDHKVVGKELGHLFIAAVG